MDNFNLKNIQRILGDSFNKKVFLLLDFTSRPGNIADPWYTGNFDETFNDIWEGCNCFLQKITNGSLRFDENFTI